MELFLINEKSLTRGEKIQLGVSYLLQLTLIIAILYSIYKHDWLNTFLTSGIFLLSSMPSILRRSYKVRLPVEIDLVVIIFVYASLFLGGMQGYYIRFWWWDVVLHASSGILLGFAGFLLVYILNTQKKIQIHMKPIFVALFSVAFAVLLGVIWEIFEFTMDSFFGLNMQVRQSGVVDTMWDLIMDLSGALAVAVVGYIYMRRERHLVEKVIRRIIGVKKK